MSDFLTDAARTKFTRDGFVIIPTVVPPDRCDTVISALSQLETGRKTRRRVGMRNLLQISKCVRELAGDRCLLSLLSQITGHPGPLPCHALLFDKTPAANWSVPWHQDLQIAVAGKIETPGFGPWSLKEGVVHVQPPAEVLESMVTLRLHLDDCDDTNGALRVIPGSHAHGILTDDALAGWRGREAVTCSLEKGGVLLMRPLLLHASSSATKPGHRRVLHLEYACEALPNGLRWHEQSWD